MSDHTAPWPTFSIPNHSPMVTFLKPSLSLRRQSTTASSRDRLQAAVQWAYLAHSLKHVSALRAYSEALVLVGRCLIAHPTVGSQHEFLAIAKSVHPSFASNAAACAIELEQPTVAVELLEQGRALLWAQMHRYRGSLEKLRAVEKKLAERFGQLSSQLEHLATY